MLEKVSKQLLWILVAYYSGSKNSHNKLPTLTDATHSVTGQLQRDATYQVIVALLQVAESSDWVGSGAKGKVSPEASSLNSSSQLYSVKVQSSHNMQVGSSWQGGGLR